MAKLSVGKGIDEYIANLQKLHDLDENDYGRAIFLGAGAVADAIAASIEAISYSNIRYDQKQGLKEGLGIAKMRNDGGLFNVKIGFDGYNKHKTEKYPNGQPNAMIARAIEKGTSFREPHKFVDPAVRKSKAHAEELMAKEIDRLISVAMEVK